MARRNLGEIADVKIRPEMIEAGHIQLSGSIWGHDAPRKILEAVYQAMEASRRATRSTRAEERSEFQ